MHEETLLKAQRAIGHEFRDMSLLIEALTHASIADDRKASNERMEFLGDAILGSIVCERIFARYPTLLEGEMTKIKSAVVSRRACAELASEMGLDELLHLGKGMRSRSELPSSLAAAVYEAVVAAIYLDAGHDAAKRFVLSGMDPLIEDAAESGHQQNFKSLLQQHAQQVLGDSPVYRVLDEKGPDHAKCFKIAVDVGGRRFESAWGPTKKQSEQQAALNALHELGVVVRDSSGQLVISEQSPEEAETV